MANRFGENLRGQRLAVGLIICTILFAIVALYFAVQSAQEFAYAKSLNSQFLVSQAEFLLTAAFVFITLGISTYLVALSESRSVIRHRDIITRQRELMATLQRELTATLLTDSQNHVNELKNILATIPKH